MKKIHCLNPIAACGTDLFPADYEITDNKAEGRRPFFSTKRFYCMKMGAAGGTFWQ